MEKPYPITVHCLVRNEDRFIWYALSSVLPFVSKVLIFDTGSTDQTSKIIKKIASPKISFVQKGPQTPASLTKLRNEMISKTKTQWFLLLDGDEVWDSKMIKSFLSFVLSQPEDTWAVFLKTRNCVGDVWHYLPETAGKYEIAGQKGNLNIRAYRKMAGFVWEGDYPLEHYGKINNEPAHLRFFPGYYWHLTNLSRSSSNTKVAGFRRHVIEKGITVSKDVLPEVFFQKAPQEVADPLFRRSFFFELAADLITPLKSLKRRVL